MPRLPRPLCALPLLLSGCVMIADEPPSFFAGWPGLHGSPCPHAAPGPYPGRPDPPPSYLAPADDGTQAPPMPAAPQLSPPVPETPPDAAPGPKPTRWVAVPKRRTT